MNDRINKMVDSIYNLTPLQNGMLYYSMLTEDSTEYVLQNILLFQGKFNGSSMKQSFSLLSEKYEVLRSIILHKSVDKPKQVVLKERIPEYREIHFDDMEQEKAYKEYLKIAEEDVKRSFDLEKDSLIRATAVYVSKEEVYLIITVHHIAIDGWCLAILIHDILRFYEEIEKKSPISDLHQVIQKERKLIAPYGDYVKWIEEQNHEEGLTYWRDLLSDYQQISTIEPIEESDVSKNTIMTEEVHLSPDESLKISEFANEHNITVSIMFEAVWSIILQKYNRTEDVVFGKVVSGRQKDIPGIEQAVGLYINTIPVRVKTDENTTILELLKNVFEQEMDSFPYDYCDLSKIENQTQLKGNLFDSIFVFENYYVQHQYGDSFEICDGSLKVSMQSSREQVNYPISAGAYNDGEQINFGIMYDNGIYTQRNIKILCSQMKVVLFNLLKNPNGAVKDILCVDEYETELILHKFNSAQIISTEYENIVEIFEKRVSEYPERIALDYEGQKLTYMELNQRANQVAFELRKLSVKPNDFVAVLIPNSLEMMIAIWGIIKSGACYVPMDLKEPALRIQYKLTDCNPKAVVTYNNSLEEYHLDCSVFDIAEYRFDRMNISNPENTISGSDLVYMIYTSGTTGKPKGVMVNHSNLLNFYLCSSHDYGICSKDKVLLFASITFDASIGQMMMTLLNGAQLVIPNGTKSGDLFYIDSLVKSKQINLLSFPPQFASQLDEIQCKYVLTAGSEASRKMVQKIVSYADYINAYGPTEATICASFWKCKKNGVVPRKVPIGKPHSNYSIYIMDGNNLCGVGIPGELCIGGKGVTCGYLNHEELTTAKFVTNPFVEGKMYLTGDLARWLPDGNIEYLGRIDEQVKVRGYRIELSEIESVMRGIEGISDCTVLDIINPSGDKCLAAYFVSKTGIESNAIKEQLRTKLPQYMIPDYVVEVENIPLTINGKVDKVKLSMHELKCQQEYVEPHTELQKKLCSIFEKILGIEKVGIQDKFFELGGNSISTIRLVTALVKEKIDVTLGEIVTLQTVEEISKSISCKDSSTADRQQTMQELYSLNNYQNMMTVGNCFSIFLLKSEEKIDRTSIQEACSKLVHQFPIIGYQYIAEKNGIMQSMHELKPKYIQNDTILSLDNIRKIIKKTLSIQDPFGILMIEDKKTHYIVLTFNQIIFDRYSTLMIFHEFMLDFKKDSTQTKSESKLATLDSKEQSQFEYISSDSHKNKYEKRRLALRKQFELRNIDLNSVKFTKEKIRTSIDNLAVVIEAAYCQLKSSDYCGLYYVEDNHKIRKPKTVGQLSDIYFLHTEHQEADVGFCLNITDDFYFCTKNSNASLQFEYEIARTEIGSISDLFIDVNIEDSHFHFNIYADEVYDDDSMNQFADLLKEKMESTNRMEDSYSKNEKAEQFTEEIRNEFHCSKLPESCCIQKNYAITTRQKVFLLTSFAGVCVGKMLVYGNYTKDQLFQAAFEMEERQSVFRSFLDSTQSEIRQIRFEERIKVPYFDISMYLLEDKEAFIRMVEDYGCCISRYTDTIPLAQHCIIKISEYIYTVYMFSHHTVSDMVSVQIWQHQFGLMLNHSGSSITNSDYAEYIMNEGKSISSMKSYDDMEYLERISDRSDFEFTFVCSSEQERRNAEQNPAKVTVSLLSEIVKIYDSNFDGNVPMLYVYHGRNAENGDIMGLFIDLYNLSYHVLNEKEMSQVNSIMTDTEKLRSCPNIMLEDNVDLTKIIHYPLININVAEVNYSKSLINDLLEDKRDISRKLQFDGISIQLIFFNDAIRFTIQCSSKYATDIQLLCKKKLGEDLKFE